MINCLIMFWNDGTYMDQQVFNYMHVYHLFWCRLLEIRARYIYDQLFDYTDIFEQL